MLEVRRLGGGFGSKIDRNHLVSVPCALAAHVMNAPVKIALDLNTNMKMIGKRYCYMNVCCPVMLWGVYENSAIFCVTLPKSCLLNCIF